jgi:hypothetical protein
MKEGEKQRKIKKENKQKNKENEIKKQITINKVKQRNEPIFHKFYD